jgi:hypothetical protein
MLIIFLTITSCSENVVVQEETTTMKIENQLQSYVDNNFNDPESYQFVGFDVFDTLWNTDIYIEMAELILDDIVDIQDKINVLDKEWEEYDYNQSMVYFSRNISSAENEMRKKFETVDSLINIMESGTEIMDGYKCLWTFRAKNNFGALILQDFFVDVDTSFNIIDIYTQLTPPRWPTIQWPHPQQKR